MKYPTSLTRVNNFIGIVCGLLFFFIALLNVYEIVMRTFFNNPSSWTMDVSKYIVIWAIYLGSSFAFQEKAHVGVEFVRDLFAKYFGKKFVKVSVLSGYLICLIVIGVLLYASLVMSQTALRFNTLTLATLQIPVVYLYAAIVAGSIFMAYTLLRIILDILSGGNNYLS